MEHQKSVRYLAYRQRRQVVEMARLFLACFGQKPQRMTINQVSGRIRQRRRRGMADAQRVVVIGLELGYLQVIDEANLLVDAQAGQRPI